MIQSIRRPSGQCLGLLFFCLSTLILPPQMLAASIAEPVPLANVEWPDYFTASFPSEGQSYEYFAQPDGSLDFRSTDGSQMGTVTTSMIDDVTITDMVDDGSNFDATFTAPDGLGNLAEFNFYGTWDSATGDVDGFLVSPDGTSRALQIQIPNADPGAGLAVPSKAIMIVIVIGAGAVLGIGCIALALITNCSRDCSAACAATGGSLKSSSEGWCGRCRCTCYPPPPPCPATPSTPATPVSGDKSVTSTPGTPIPACPRPVETYNATAIPFSALR